MPAAEPVNCFAGLGRVGARVAFLALVVWAMGAGAGGAQTAPRSTGLKATQAQAASWFLRAILRGDYAGAYGRLAPEVRRAVTRERFETAARPLWKSGQRRGQEIELYKLGVRLAGPSARLFYAFTFAADSGSRPPPAVLEVVFRDTAARAVLGFGLRTGAKAVPKRLAPAATGRNGGLRR